MFETSFVIIIIVVIVLYLSVWLVHFITLGTDLRFSSILLINYTNFASTCLPQHGASLGSLNWMTRKCIWIILNWIKLIIWIYFLWKWERERQEHQTRQFKIYELLKSFVSLSMSSLLFPWCRIFLETKNWRRDRLFSLYQDTNIIWDFIS